MSTPTLIFLLAIIAVLPAAIRVTGRPSVRVRNPTAVALIAMWLFGRVIWWLTREWLPVSAMLIQDMAVIAAMLVKEDWRTCSYENDWHQFTCLWHERTPWDKAILSVFPLAWLFYWPGAAAAMGPAVRLFVPVAEDGQIQFWILWSIGLGQLILAGWEGYHLAGNGQTLRADDERPPGLEFTAWGMRHA